MSIMKTLRTGHRGRRTLDPRCPGNRMGLGLWGAEGPAPERRELGREKPADQHQVPSTPLVADQCLCVGRRHPFKWEPPERIRRDNPAREE